MNKWKRLAAAALCGALLSGGITGAAAAYADVPAGAWYAQAAEYCREKGLMDGYGDGRFGPEDGLSRAQLAQILYNRADRPAPTGGAAFTDTPAGAWYRPAVSWAAEQGIVSGYGGGLFGPDDPVTREQLAAILWRHGGKPAADRESGCPDRGEVSPYAREAVDWASSAGIMAALEDGSFRPGQSATRAQTAAALMNYLTRFAGGRSLSSVSAMDVMCAPSGITAMADGTVLVTDTYYKQLWRVRERTSQVYAGGETVAGLYGEPLGGYNDDEVLEGYFKRPWAVAEFLDGWAVSDTDNGAIRLVRAEKIQTVNGSTRELLSTSKMGVAFDRPTGLASDGEGNLYVADTGKGAVRKITPKGVVTTAASGLNEPTGLCWRDGVLYIAETGANRIVKLEKGRVSTVAGSGEDSFLDGPADRAAFSGPQGVTAAEDGAIYVADTLNSAVRRVRDGQVDTLTVRDTALAEFGLVSPRGLLILGNRLYICDGFARKVFVLELD